MKRPAPRLFLLLLLLCVGGATSAFREHVPKACDLQDEDGGIEKEDENIEKFEACILSELRVTPLEKLARGNRIYRVVISRNLRERLLVEFVSPYRNETKSLTVRSVSGKVLSHGITELQWRKLEKGWHQFVKSGRALRRASTKPIDDHYVCIPNGGARVEVNAGDIIRIQTDGCSPSFALAEFLIENAEEYLGDCAVVSREVGLGDGIDACLSASQRKDRP